MIRPVHSVCILILMVLVLSIGQSQAEITRPNIVLILADDFGYECVGANGGQSYQTPHLDQLAASGVRFEHCHVQPLCTPTRVQLMTGKSNIRNYLNFGTLVRTETTFGQLFQRAGYRTAVCGKWQLGREKDSPQHFGFHESCLWQHTRRPPRYANPGLEYNGIERDFRQGEYGPDLVNQFALEFIETNRERPFLLYYPMILTHNPFQPTPDSDDWDPRINDEKQKDRPEHFADMTAYMDKLVGKLVAKLDALKIRDNTIVLFLGDNGTNKNLTSSFRGSSYRGGKGSTTIRGTHVPLIASWPSKIKSPNVNRDLVCSTDILPTICQAAKIDIPTGLDGVSILPQIQGEPGTPRNWIYSWYSPRQQKDLTVREFVFDQRYKLYRSGELYDMEHDPDEKHPLKVDLNNALDKEVKTKLQVGLDRFERARPIELDQAFQASKP
jgi:arylsulfatase A